MTSEFEENDIEKTAEEEAEEEAEYETEEEAAEEEAEEEAEYETEEEAEYKNEEEAESETEENQVDDTETEEQQIEKNIEREVEQEETNTKKRSWVWKHFTYDETVKKAKCKHCKILITCNKGSTLGMASHIKSKHKLMKEKGKKQLTIRESINNSEVIVYSKETFKKFIIRWIVKNDLPFTCVESEDFRSMISLLHKDAFIPSADTIKNYIMTSFNDSQKKVASILQILGVTTDNASNNITFLKAVESDLSQRYIYYDSDDKHVRCLAHIINLAAQQVLTTLKATDNDESSNEEVGSLIVKLRTLIKKIKASPQQVDKFKAQCKVANVPNLNVILDVRTRCNSTYDMLVRARKLKEPFNILSNSDSNLRPFTINEDEWINLLEIEELLKYFAKATKQICGEAYPTLSYVIPIYNILLNKLEDFRDTPNRFENGKEAAINAINKLKIYYNKTDSTLYAVSLILDPRLKVEYMKDNEWETQWVDRTKKTVSELYMTLYAPQETQNTNIEYNSSDEDLVSHISKRRRIESVSEFDRYFNANRAQALCDTLNWWKRHEEEYSNLSNMAKDYLGVPATSAPAERIFSSAADVIIYNKASLAPETLFGWRRIGYSGKLWMNNLHQKKMIDIISYDNLTSLQHNVENVWKMCVDSF
ncbi:unnamed protein product [Rhizophagus irregularis]|nr:unnamed protein product [Rhizophagus irregularis]